MEKVFRKYMHVERFGTSEVSGIELGDCYVFPKIDGTNASVWLGDDGEIKAGSRRRELETEADNAGFYNWVVKQENILAYLKENPTHRLFGEWLVPHSLKTYRDDAWRQFYVFDVAIDAVIEREADSPHKYIHYEEYKPLLEKYGINYISPISIVQNGDYDKFVSQLEKNTYLIKDGSGAGEGIVIKNYDFVNKYGRQIWAKIVTSEFKEKHSKTMGPSILKSKKLVEESIAEKYVTKALCEKVYAKIENDNDGFSNRNIPQLLNTVYYDVVREECWSFVKENKNPTINFKTLQSLVFAKVKEQMNI